MKTQATITKEQFSKRLAALCLRGGSTGFPKNEIDEHILLKSAILIIPSAESYSEAEINDALKYWVEDINTGTLIDHGMLRRRLFDTGYLNREKDGSSYQIARPGPLPELFEAGIEQINVLEVITSGREEIEHRKQEYLKKARNSKKP
jgi:hypothetical protein